MSNQAASPIIEKPKKKSILKRWWFWLLAVIVIFIIIIALSSGGTSTAYELSQLQTISKQQIVDKFGKPDEVVREDSEGYIYAYNAGFMVRGADQGALEITLQDDMVKGSSADTYKIFDVTIGSSYDEHVSRLGSPNLTQSKDGAKNAMYLTDEDFLLLLSTQANSDKIARIQYVAYNDSLEAVSLDLSNLLGLTATEDELRSLYEIQETSSSQGETLYVLNGFEMIVDDQSRVVQRLFLTTDSIYNIHGIRIHGSIERANQILSDPINTSEGVKNTTRYSYLYEGAPYETQVHLSADNETNQIGYIEVALQ